MKHRNGGNPSEVCKADPRATPASTEQKAAERCTTRKQLKPAKGARPAVMGSCASRPQWSIGGALHCTKHAAEKLREG